MNAEELLRNLGIAGNLKGFRYAVHMIELVEKDPSLVCCFGIVILLPEEFSIDTAGDGQIPFLLQFFVKPMDYLVGVGFGDA